MGKISPYSLDVHRICASTVLVSEHDPYVCSGFQTQPPDFVVCLVHSDAVFYNQIARIRAIYVTISFFQRLRRTMFLPLVDFWDGRARCGDGNEEEYRLGSLQSREESY